MSLLLLVVMSLAAYRAWRFLAQDTWPPSEWFRAALDAEVEDAKGRRLWVLNYAQDLIECPWCLGAWISAAVVAWVDLFQGLELPVLQWLAVACLVGLIGSNLDG